MTDAGGGATGSTAKLDNAGADPKAPLVCNGVRAEVAHGFGDAQDRADSARADKPLIKLSKYRLRQHRKRSSASRAMRPTI